MMMFGEIVFGVLTVLALCLAGFLYFWSFVNSGIIGKTFMAVATYLSFKYIFFYDGPLTNPGIGLLGGYFAYYGLGCYCSTDACI